MAWIALPQRPQTSGVLSFRLIEPAGLRRVAEPISAIIPNEGENLRFRLVRDGRAIPAQFGPIIVDGARTGWRLDFAADLGPDERARFELHHGTLIQPGPAPAGRWDLESTPDDFRIARDRVPVFRIARTLRPRGGADVDRLAPSPIITLRDGGTIRPGSPEFAVTSIITREGPFALGLRFAWTGPGRVASRLDLDFPSTRDQAAVLWTVDDPEDRVESIRLELDARPIQSPAAIRSGPGPSPLWASSEDPHRRILAIVEGEDGPDEPASIAISPEGRLAVARRFAKGTCARTLAFRFDVSGPARASGRMSSVESLLRPIRLEWDQPAPSRA